MRKEKKGQTKVGKFN